MGFALGTVAMARQLLGLSRERRGRDGELQLAAFLALHVAGALLQARGNPDVELADHVLGLVNGRDERLVLRAFCDEVVGRNKFGPGLHAG